MVQFDPNSQIAKDYLPVLEERIAFDDEPDRYKSLENIKENVRKNNGKNDNDNNFISTYERQIKTGKNGDSSSPLLDSSTLAPSWVPDDQAEK